MRISSCLWNITENPVANQKMEQQRYFRIMFWCELTVINFQSQDSYNWSKPSDPIWSYAKQSGEGPL